MDIFLIDKTFYYITGKGSPVYWPICDYTDYIKLPIRGDTKSESAVLVHVLFFGSWLDPALVQFSCYISPSASIPGYDHLTSIPDTRKPVMYPGDPSLERCFSLLHHWERFTWVSTGNLPILGRCMWLKKSENTKLNIHSRYKKTHYVPRWSFPGKMFFLIASLGKVHLGFNGRSTYTIPRKGERLH